MAAYGVASRPGPASNWPPMNEPLEIPRLKAAMLKPEAVPSASGAISFATATTPDCMTGGIANAKIPQTAIAANIAMGM